MVFGIRLPPIFSRKSKRIGELLKEAEDIASRELESEKILAALYKTFFDFLQESKQEKIQQELMKNYADIEKVEVLKPYFKRISVSMSNIISRSFFRAARITTNMSVSEYLCQSPRALDPNKRISLTSPPNLFNNSFLKYHSAAFSLAGRLNF